MTSTVNNRWGTFSIDDKVIEQIASRTTMESYGIVGLAARGPKENIYRLLRRENMGRGVRVLTTGPRSILIQIHVILDAGVRISTVAQNVIETVKYNVETKTGLTVDSVDVIVQGVRV